MKGLFKAIDIWSWFLVGRTSTSLFYHLLPLTRAFAQQTIFHLFLGVVNYSNEVAR